MLDTSNTVTNKLYVAVTLHIIFQFPNNFGSAGSGSATILQITRTKKLTWIRDKLSFAKINSRQVQINLLVGTDGTGIGAGYSLEQNIKRKHLQCWVNIIFW